MNQSTEQPNNKLEYLKIQWIGGLDLDVANMHFFCLAAERHKRICPYTQTQMLDQFVDPEVNRLALSMNQLAIGGRGISAIALLILKKNTYTSLIFS